MFARCPACQTVFRVRPEQLRAHRGEVRCGHCYTPFNALEHLLEIAPPSAPAPTEPPPASAQPPQPAPAEPETEPDSGEHFFVLEDKPDESFSDQLDFDIPDALLPPRTAFEREPEARIAPSIPAAPPFAFPPALPTDKVADTSAPMRIGPEEPAPSFGGPYAEHEFTDPGLLAAAPSADDAATERAVKEEEEPDTPALTPLREARREPAILPETDFTRHEPDERTADLDEDSTQTPAWKADGDFASIDETQDDYSQLDARYGPAATSPARRWLLGLSIGVLAGTLAAQSIYLFRADIAREWPLLRPALLNACRYLHCDVALPKNAGAISVEGSDLQSEPGKPGRFVFNATIRNRAPYPQAYPHLELTLTDAQDRPLVRRVLTPPEWSPGADLERGFAAGRDIALTLPFEASGLDASGYRIYVFYP